MKKRENKDIKRIILRKSLRESISSEYGYIAIPNIDLGSQLVKRAHAMPFNLPNGYSLNEEMATLEVISLNNRRLRKKICKTDNSALKNDWCAIGRDYDGAIRKSVRDYAEL